MTNEREALEALFAEVHGPKPPRIHGGSQELTDWLNLHNPFVKMLDADAYLDAALMLIPEAWCWRIMPADSGTAFLAEVWTDDTLDGEFGAREDTPALALCAAIKAARDAQ